MAIFQTKLTDTRTLRIEMVGKLTPVEECFMKGNLHMIASVINKGDYEIQSMSIILVDALIKRMEQH